VSFACLSTFAVLLPASWAPIPRTAFRPLFDSSISCIVSASIPIAMGCIISAIRFVFLGVHSHILQPLVQGHISVVEVRPQLIEELVISRVTTYALAILIGFGALGSCKSLGVWPRRLYYLFVRKWLLRMHICVYHPQLHTLALLAGPKKDLIHRGAAIIDDVATCMPHHELLQLIHTSVVAVTARQKPRPSELTADLPYPAVNSTRSKISLLFLRLQESFFSLTLLPC
jgi:hypothetical protein